MGVAWSSVAFDDGRLSVTRTPVDLDGDVSVSSDPKTARGRRFIALDVGTVSALPTQRVAQAQERLMPGAEYVDHDLVFARPDGLASTVVQERLGHSTIGITPDVYSHVLPSMETDAATGSRR